jgi:hypothetical protein
MQFKKTRLGSKLLEEAVKPNFFNQVHVVFGGSGAVGGATVIHLISFFEEAIRLYPKLVEYPPYIIVTANTKSEIRQFTSMLFRLQKRDYGSYPLPFRDIGYKTVKGVIIDLQVFTVNPNLPELVDFSIASQKERQTAIHEFLKQGGLGINSTIEQKIALLRRAIQERLGQPFTEFLIACKERFVDGRTLNRYRSVTVSIPLASVAAYKLKDLEEVCSYLGLEPENHLITELKTDYLQALSNDLARVARDLADNVLVAHTTAVGGMYDEVSDGTRTIRLGFAHSAMDERLVHKQAFAEKLAKLYADLDIKILITAAAIGIDSILEHKTPPISAAIRKELKVAEANGFQILPKADIKAGVLQVYSPVSLDLLTEEHEPLSFKHGHPLNLDYVLKSGENGFFTASNAEALYRVMRVTSNTELGLLLARTAAFGDDKQYPFFVNNICYYTESDYSRQVFDLLGQPQLRKDQLSGLQPKALQDLGSAKHQSELHILGLLILLHRLRTLNLGAISRHIDLRIFNPHEFFENNSNTLTLNQALSWDVRSLSSDLAKLLTATTESDLEQIKHLYQSDPKVQEAIHRVLRSVLSAAHSITSLGTPILYEVGGRKRVMAGYYAAPIDKVLTHNDTLHIHLKQEFLRAGGGDADSFERFIEFYCASFGFLDIRPIAVLVTSSSAQEASNGAVQVFREEAPFLEALQKLKPYSYYTTSGLIALMVRLKSLWQLSYELDFKLGSQNEFRAHFYYDEGGYPLLVPGLIEAFRMISEGLEKSTGLERIDGPWGY